MANYLRPIAIFLAALFGYWLCAELLGGTGENVFSYFDRQAAAWLNGDLFTRVPVRHDLTYYDGRWYVAFPPLTSILMLPWLYAADTVTLDAILFSVIFGAVNTLIVYGILQETTRNGWSTLTSAENTTLTFLFAFGTVHWYMTLQGTVWFLAQITAFTFLALATWLALRGTHPLWVGLALAIAMLGRPHMVLALPFLMGVWLNQSADTLTLPSIQTMLRWAIPATLPALVAIGLLLGYNQARFDDWRDFGYLTQNVDNELEPDLEQYGQFNSHFIPRNARALFWAMPIKDDASGWYVPDRWGLSIFLTTPALLTLFWARRRAWAVVGAWLSIGLILIPLLTYYNTGWWQFGYRFSLDFMPLLMVLLAIGVSRVSAERTGMHPMMRTLIALSIFSNAYGTLWFALITGRLGPPG